MAERNSLARSTAGFSGEANPSRTTWTECVQFRLVSRTGIVIRHMPDDLPSDDFDRIRDQALDAIEQDDIASMYVGVIPENGTNEYYFGNTVEDAELREMAGKQLGMMARVLADQSEWSVEEVAQHAVEQAASMRLQP